MGESKTQPTGASVDDFLEAVADDGRRADCRQLAKIMQRATGAEPKMWGANMVGFGSYHYVYESGREGDMFLTGFAPRRNDLTLYIMGGLSHYDAILRRMGRFKSGKSCLYVKRLADLDLAVLEELINASVRRITLMNP